MEEQTSQELNQNKKKNINIKPFNFFIAFILISTLFAFILGGIFIGKENAKQNIRDEKTTIKEQIEIDPKVLPGNPDNWITYEFKPLNLVFKLPEELNKKEDWKVIEISGESGAQICFSDENLENKDECKSEILVISSTSRDFSAKRDLNFLDLQGFETENEKYYINTTEKRLELENVKFKLFENNKNFKIIKILGKENLLDESQININKTLSDGYLGAVVNTNNLDFPAVVLKMKIGDEISEYEFDQILESIKKIE